MATDTRAPLRHVWITAALLIASSGWYVAFALGGGGPVAIGYAAVPLGSATSAVFVWRLLRTVPLGSAARRFWRSVLVALTLMTVAYAGDFVHALRWATRAWQPDIPPPLAAIAGFGFGAFLWAVVRVPLTVTDRGERQRMRLDRGIALLGCATVFWQVGLAPMITAAVPAGNSQTTGLTGIAFLLAIVSITKVAYLTDNPVDRTALRLIAASMMAGAVISVLTVTLGPAGNLPAQAVVVPFCPLIVAVAARSQWQSVLTPRPVSRRANTLLPYLAVAAVDVPLIAVAFAGHLHWTDRLSVLAAVVVNGLVAVRQYLAFRENAALVRGIRAQEVRLQYEVTHDGLTGLANRTLFRDRLDAALTNGLQPTVLLLDLDDFKTVNDSLGHDVGDALLIAVAAVLSREERGLAVRLAGDEFALLLPDPQGCAGEQAAARILDGLSEPVGEHRLLVQASIGITTARPGASVDALFREADVAMYAAKQRGKAGFVRYEDGMEEPVLAHIQLGGELRRGLERHEFRVVYQPIMSLENGRIIGVEALVRWDHPIRGVVPPVEFIPAAERTGLIVPLGRFVLRETCRQAAAWLAEFGPEALQKVGPNVSVRQLHDPDFVADVIAALADHGLPTDRLVLELTESAALRGNQVAQTLRRLDAMGVKLALDDFGTGESSLSLLTAFPAAIIKLDKSFVDGVEIDDPDSDARQAVARAVIQLARALRRDTVAEGIENQAQADRLRELGYTLGQGYHLARPMPPEQLSRLLAAQQAAVPA